MEDGGHNLVAAWSQRGDCFTPTLVLNAPRLSRILGKLNWDLDELLLPYFNAEVFFLLLLQELNDISLPAPKLLIMTAAAEAAPFHSKHYLRVGFTDNKPPINAVRGSSLLKFVCDIIVVFPKLPELALFFVWFTWHVMT